MKSIALVAALSALAIPSLAADFPISRTLGAPKIVPNKVLVELTNPGVVARDGSGHADIHARFIADLERRLAKGSYRVRKNYSSAVFSGVSVDINNIDDLKTVAGAANVQAVRPVSLVKAPTLKIDKGALEQAKGTPNPGQYAPNIMTGVDRVHKTGNRGKGIKIGIIDSGIDYTHPALGGGFGPKFKVVGGYDFVGDNYDPSTGTVTPDSDPFDTCNGHGTHVAGILGANPGNMYNVTGVAYEASLRSYRVFGCNMLTDDAIILDALLRAYDEGNDVITLSIGGYSGWSTSTAAVVASRIAKRGRVVTVAAGNEGDFGAWFAESPASGVDVISVASVENIAAGPLFTIKSDLANAAPMPYQWNGGLTAIPVGNETLPVYATSKDSAVEDDACNELPESTPDLSQYATLVRRGTCSFTQKIQNVIAKGGKTIIIYNNGGPFNVPNFEGYDYAVLVQDGDGLALLDGINAGKKVMVSFPQDKALSTPNTRSGGLVSSFSTYGPTFDMLMKPAIAAPGGGILSTYPQSLGSFQVASGTSMATPHVAGLAALLLKARGKNYATQVRSILQTTSGALPETLNEDSRRHTLAQAGAGLANLYNALTYTTVVQPAELLLNDTAHWRGKHTIVIRNTGRKTRTYKIKHVAAGTAQSLIPGTNHTAAGPVPLDDTAVSVRLSQSRVILGAGRSASISVNITPPTDSAPNQIPIVSGHIEVSTQGETLRVSYLGAASDLRKAAIVDTSPDVVGLPFPFVIDAQGAVQQTAQNYSFVGEDYPVLSWRQSLGSARMTMDLVKPDLVLPTANGATILVSPEPAPAPEEPAPEDAPLEKRGIRKGWLPGLIGSWGHGRPKPIQPSSYSRVATLGQLGAYEYLRRHNMIDDPYSQFAVMNVFANGTAVPKGEYRVLVRWLKLGGEPLKQEHYESWMSPVMNFV